MPRFRNMNEQQQARVRQQMQSGNYGQGAAGRVAERRAGRIQTTPNLVSQPAPAPQPPPAPAPMQPRPRPMQPPAMEQAQPQMSMKQKPWGAPAPMQESYAQKQMAGPAMKQPGMFSPQTGTYQDRGQMAGQAIDQMRAKMPPPLQKQPPMAYGQAQQQLEAANQYQPMQKPMGQFQGY